MDDWHLDVVMTASQKAIGLPPGLAIMMVSQRALETFYKRKEKETCYYASWGKWIPVMLKYEYVKIK